MISASLFNYYFLPRFPLPPHACSVLHLAHLLLPHSKNHHSRPRWFKLWAQGEAVSGSLLWAAAKGFDPQSHTHTPTHTHTCPVSLPSLASSSPQANASIKWMNLIECFDCCCSVHVRICRYHVLLSNIFKSTGIACVSAPFFSSSLQWQHFKGCICRPSSCPFIRLTSHNARLSCSSCSHCGQLCGGFGDHRGFIWKCEYEGAVEGYKKKKKN